MTLETEALCVPDTAECRYSNLIQPIYLHPPFVTLPRPPSFTWVYFYVFTYVLIPVVLGTICVQA